MAWTAGPISSDASPVSPPSTSRCDGPSTVASPRRRAGRAGSGRGGASACPGRSPPSTSTSWPMPASWRSASSARAAGKGRAQVGRRSCTVRARTRWRRPSPSAATTWPAPSCDRRGRARAHRHAGRRLPTRVADAAGRRIGEGPASGGAEPATTGETVVDVLGEHGYEPELDAHHEIALANCPFHRLAVEHRDLVCGMNLDFLDGLLEGMASADGLTARLEPSLVTAACASRRRDPRAASGGSATSSAARGPDPSPDQARTAATSSRSLSQRGRRADSRRPASHP